MYVHANVVCKQISQWYTCTCISVGYIQYWGVSEGNNNCIYCSTYIRTYVRSGWLLVW